MKAIVSPSRPFFLYRHSERAQIAGKRLVVGCAKSADQSLPIYHSQRKKKRTEASA
jgi:hypothetical protein